MLIFCRKISINKPKFLKENGPLLLACNHPNSFLDAIILDLLFEKPIWSLARGDAFANLFVKKIFRGVKMLPVYRASEGIENVSENYKTFDACVELFKSNGLVIIFSEGRCINEWHLRPLMKGTARLALKSWDESIPLKILPVGLNYSSFRRFGKNVSINFGELMTASSIDRELSEGLQIQAFNNQLEMQLKSLVYEIKKDDIQKQKELLQINYSLFYKILFAIPAIFGWVLHAPIYFLLKKIVTKYFRRSDHFDSVLIALLVFVYPLYLFSLVLLLFYCTENYWVFLLFGFIPFTAYCFTQLKGQLDKI